MGGPPVEPAASEGRRRGERSVRRSLIELALLIALAWLTSQFVVGTVGIRGRSMAPTLEPGERALLFRYDRLAYRLGASPYRAGDVVVFTPPDGAGGTPLIKRVVAVAGETVELRDGVLFVAGSERTEPYLADGITSAIDRGPILIPERRLYVLGDNRAPLGSQDSRRFGPIDAGSVLGRVPFVLWPPVRPGDGWSFGLRRLGV